VANLVLLGPPGSGKGTQAGRLSADLRIPAISTGDILRALEEAATPVSDELHQYLDTGELVPDGLVIEIIRQRLHDKDTRQGFILDGFPRTTAQAAALDSMLDSVQRPIDAVIYLEIAPSALLSRLTVRHRADDRPEIVAHRIDVYLVQTAPLIEYYRAAGRLIRVNADRPPVDVMGSIREALAAIVAGSPPSADVSAPS
jgi:adenylate kinase